MANIIIYTKPTCPYCINAKQLLNSKGVNFDEIDVSQDLSLRQQMQQLSGRYTVPQIFIDNNHIGGCSELYALEQNQSLDVLLN